jgi:ribosomal protein S18 acetylase RimI-like enzyme
MFKYHDQKRLYSLSNRSELPDMAMGNLEFFFVNTFCQALKMRSIRNECRENMTQDTSYISLTRQIKWFWKSYLSARKKGDMLGMLARDQVTGKVVGYGLIRKDRNNRVWISGGLSKKYRGMGYGKPLFSFITKFALIENKEVFLEVLTKNTIAYNIYLSLGYKRFCEAELIIYMKKEYK